MVEMFVTFLWIIPWNLYSQGVTQSQPLEFSIHYTLVVSQDSWFIHYAPIEYKAAIVVVLYSRHFRERTKRTFFLSPLPESVRKKC